MSIWDTKAFEGARVMVTGGTGSVGHRLVSRLANAGAREIRVVGRKRPRVPFGRLPSCEVGFIAADIAAPSGVVSLLSGIDMVFHLAAMKDVPSCEESPLEAVRTNVLGSSNVIAAAIAQPTVSRLLATSTDKACAPTSVLGMTKALMERLISRASREEARSFGAIRLGNVWGASGSVLTRWRQTAAEDGHIDVTEPTMTRFVLMPDEAVEMIMTAALQHFSGEVIAPRMRAYRLGDLAEAFCAEHNARTRVVGRRRGEKIHEDLVSEEEAVNSRQIESMYQLGGTGAPGIAPFNSGHADRLSVGELRDLVRAS
jgi:UDP-N-acetylglucosamine 4,6-dehydratase